MLTDIFSSLDCYAGGSWDLRSWVVSQAVFLTGLVLIGHFFGKTWVLPSMVCLASWILVGVMFEVVIGCGGSRMGVFSLGHIGVFIVLLLLNFGGMVPGVFSLTSHLSVGSVFGVGWWFWSVFSGWWYSPSKFLAHLLPSGTPSILCPLMVMIESVSITIRPVTLSVRLVANVMMGHLVMSLVGDYVCASWVGGGYWVVGGYMVFEVLVCILQAYVFTLLVSLYSSEHP
uniref:ATP synthase subunit a n=1 Tax=Margaritifera margaritifera TaxID=2505931 RepID=A0A4Y5QSG8_9BIVA|nr:ATP synthase F0 subunit 6 [Margaritifera margaritifera]